jgi:F-type H+-transporting ATPase subunit b
MKRVGVLSVALSALIALAPFAAMASEGHGEGGTSLPQLDATLYPGLLFWAAVTFALFFVMMKTVAVPAMRDTQERRKSVIDADLASARDASEDAQKIMEENEAANSESTEQREKQHQELTHRLQVAEENLNEARNKAMKDAPQFINDLVSEIVAKATTFSQAKG